ncbi:hypothetical protein [Tabrizicola sp.]|uniref:hypothetical protein n=1 Tax=Tabrizicola sp. TaxID=2005166 RepID=UPI0035AE8E45
MQVTQETPARLVLEQRPWVLGAVLGVCIVILLALAMVLWRESAWLTLGFGLAALLLAVCLVLFVQRVIVIFDRAAGAMVIRTRSLMGEDEKTLPLTDILRAEVETSRSTSTSNDGNLSVSVTHRTVLVTGAGPLPLTQSSSAGASAEVNAAAINRWLAASDGPPGA